MSSQWWWVLGGVAIVILVGVVVGVFTLILRPVDRTRVVEAGGIRLTIHSPKSVADLVEGAPDTGLDGEYIYIEIPDPVYPIERDRKYGVPLEEALAEDSLGEVAGSGSGGGIDAVFFDVVVRDIDRAIPVIAAALREAGAPREGTVLHYGDDATYDVWGDGH